MDLRHDQRLGLLDALPKDDDLRSSPSFVPGLPDLDSMSARRLWKSSKFVSTFFSIWFFIPLLVDEFSQVRMFDVDILLQMCRLLVEAFLLTSNWSAQSQLLQLLRGTAGRPPSPRSMRLSN
jgi:hypothetical protein